MIGRITAVSIAALSMAATASAGPRRSGYVEASFAVGAHPAIGSDLDAGVPLSLDFKLGFGLWLHQRVGAFAQVGFVPELSISDTGIAGQVSTVEERLRYLPVRAGAKLNLWPRASWIQLNLVGAASALYGSHELSFDGTIQASESIVSVGGGAGLEINLVKFKRAGLSLSGMYFIQPAALADDAGFRASGTTDLGGVEVWISVVRFLGGPR